jgi:hypothetical protein
VGGRGRSEGVFDEIPIAPGPLELDILFAVVGGDSSIGVPPLHLRKTVEAPRRGVALVTRDDGSGELAVR